MPPLVRNLAWRHVAPAICAVVIALSLVSMALVVRRAMVGRGAAAPSAGDSPATSTPESPAIARIAPDISATPSATKPQSPAPMVPPPAPAQWPAVVETKAPRVRSVASTGGLSFPPARLPDSAIADRSQGVGGMQVAATAEQLPPGVLGGPSLEELPGFPSTASTVGGGARITLAPAPPPAAPSSSVPTLAGPSLAVPSREAPSFAAPSSANSPAGGVTSTPGLEFGPPADAQPLVAAPANVRPTPPSPSSGVLAFPPVPPQAPLAASLGPSQSQLAAQPFPVRPSPLNMPPARTPPTETIPRLDFAATPDVRQAPAPSIETIPRPQFAAPPEAPQAIPNPWSTFNASAALGRFVEHGTITLADVRLTALRNNKDIAVLGHVPRLAATGIDVEASEFDPTFNVAVAGGHYDRQTATQVESLGSGVPVLKTSFWQPITAPNQIWVDKKFVTGGEVQLGVGQNYLNYSPAGSFVLVNPTHQASVNLSVEQPLFRGRGPAATMAATEIARANGAQSWHAFQATVNQALRDAEAAYWEMYAAYQEFEVRDLALAQARTTVERERERLRIGEGSIPDVAQAQEQAEAFHIERTRAEIELVQAQRNLRRLMGLAPGDERPLIPATTPDDEPPVVDWETAAAEARNRPEFAAQAAAVEAAEIELRRRQNGLLPDLSLQGIYAVSGLDSDFGNAWGSLGTFNYNDWTAGVVYQKALGRRSDRALEQRACEALSMESARLNQLEHEILHQLDAAYKNVQASASLVDLHRRRREAAAVQLDARRELYLENRAALRDQLDAEARYASAMLDESLAKVAYRRAVTDWNYARGAMTGDTVLVRQ